jgi:hypothetical protein
MAGAAEDAVGAILDTAQQVGVRLDGFASIPLLSWGERGIMPTGLKLWWRSMLVVLAGRALRRVLRDTPHG